MIKQSVVLNVVLALVIVVLSIRLVSSSAPAVGHAPATPADSSAVADADGFTPFDVTKTFADNPFSFFTGHGLLLCAGDAQGANAMTIGWGGLGTLWGRPALTVYVRQGRYTHQFMERGRYFTVMRFADNEVVDYMGSHSGRDGDKAAALGLTLAYTKNGAPYYKEASMVIECRLVAATELTEATFRDELPRSQYAPSGDDGGLHTEYIGEVVGAMKKKCCGK